MNRDTGMIILFDIFGFDHNAETVVFAGLIFEIQRTAEPYHTCRQTVGTVALERTGTIKADCFIPIHPGGHAVVMPRLPFFGAFVKGIVVKQFAFGLGSDLIEFSGVQIGQIIFVISIDIPVAEKLCTHFFFAGGSKFHGFVDIFQGFIDHLVSQSIQITAVTTLQKGYLFVAAFTEPLGFNYFVIPEIFPHSVVFFERHRGFFAHGKIEPFVDKSIGILIDIPQKFGHHVNFRRIFPCRPGGPFVEIETQIVFVIKLFKERRIELGIVRRNQQTAFKTVIPPAESGSGFIPLLQAFFQSCPVNGVHIEFEFFADHGYHRRIKFDTRGHIFGYPVIEYTVITVGVFLFNDFNDFIHPFVVALTFRTFGQMGILFYTVFTLADIAVVVDRQ